MSAPGLSIVTPKRRGSASSITRPSPSCASPFSFFKGRRNRDFLEAAKWGDVSKVSSFVLNGAPVDVTDDQGWTPLMEAVASHHFDTVVVLVENGANVNWISKNGWTPLLLACTSGDDKMAMYLIEHGARVDVVVFQDGVVRCPLLTASKQGHAAVVRELVSAGMRVDIPVIESGTPAVKSPPSSSQIHSRINSLVDYVFPPFQAAAQSEDEAPLLSGFDDLSVTDPVAAEEIIVSPNSATPGSVSGRSRAESTGDAALNKNQPYVLSYLAQIFVDFAKTAGRGEMDLFRSLLAAGLRTDLSLPPCNQYRNILLDLAVRCGHASACHRLLRFPGMSIGPFLELSCKEWADLHVNGFRWWFCCSPGVSDRNIALSVSKNLRSVFPDQPEDRTNICAFACSSLAQLLPGDIPLCAVYRIFSFLWDFSFDGVSVSQVEDNAEN